MSNIFISYSHKDEEWKDKLVTHLRVLEIEGSCTLWDDRKIKVGNDWFPEIEKALNEAQIVIMLITANFLTSNFIRKEEVPRISSTASTQNSSNKKDIKGCIISASYLISISVLIAFKNIKPGI